MVVLKIEYVYIGQYTYHSTRNEPAKKTNLFMTGGGAKIQCCGGVEKGKTYMSRFSVT